MTARRPRETSGRVHRYRPTPHPTRHTREAEREGHTHTHTEDRTAADKLTTPRPRSTRALLRCVYTQAAWLCGSTAGDRRQTTAPPPESNPPQLPAHRGSHSRTHMRCTCTCTDVRFPAEGPVPRQPSLNARIEDYRLGSALERLFRLCHDFCDGCCCSRCRASALSAARIHRHNSARQHADDGCDDSQYGRRG